MNLIGKTLGNYLIDEKIGEGGMGLVFSAHHVHTHRKVAIKALRQGLGGDAKVRERLIQEQQILDQVRHTNIVALHDIYFEGPAVYLVMEFVEGLPLDEYLHQHGPLDPETVAAIGLQLTSALALAHAAGVIHRDIKPSNIMVADAGDGGVRVKLLDFGIAKAADSAGLTLPGMVMGSPAYLPPERWEADELTPATDIYPLGMCLWESLAGRAAYDGGSGWRTYYKLHTERDVPDVREVLPDAPVWLALVIHKATRREPSERFSDGGAMQAALQQRTPRGAALSERRGADAGEASDVPTLAVTQRRGPSAEAGSEPHWSERAAGALDKPGSQRSEKTRAFLRQAQKPYQRIAQGLTAAAGLVFLGIVAAAVLIAGGIVAYALLHEDAPPVFVLELTNLKKGDVSLECTAGAGELEKTWKERLPAGQEASIAIPTFPASCWELNATGGRDLVWTTPGWVSIIDDEPAVADVDPDDEPVDVTPDAAQPEKTAGPAPAKVASPSKEAETQPKKAAPKDEPQEPRVARVFLGVAEAGAQTSCDDLVALEVQAVMGELEPSTVACLEKTISSGESMVDRSKCSRLLIVNAHAGNDQVAWERLTRRHLDEIELSDPDICLAYARQMSMKADVNSKFTAIKYAGLGLESKGELKGDAYVKHVTSLHHIRASAAVDLWKQYEEVYEKERTPTAEEAAERLRSKAKEYSREWLDYAIVAGGDVDSAKAICRSAAGTATYCD